MPREGDREGRSAAEPHDRRLLSRLPWSSRGPDGSVPAWTARSTLLAFAFLALAAQLPGVVDIYAYGGLPRLLYVPSYILTAVVYALVDPVEPLLEPEGVAGRLLFGGGPLVAFYLASVLATLVGRRLASAGRSVTGGRSGSAE